MNISKWLKDNSETEFKDFSVRLVKTRYDILGIRLPKLRKYAKDLVNRFGADALSRLSDDTFEEIMLQGFVVAYLKTDFEVKKILIDNYLRKCDNWSLIDSFASSFKLKDKDYQNGWKMLNEYKNNQMLLQEKPYIERFVLCLSMNLYLNDQYIDEILKYSEILKDRKYAVKMANSWLLATAAIKYFDKVIDVIIKMDEETIRYFKGKIRDSYRIDEDKKERIKQIWPKK
ncbi:MAG TPA: DNA alkylation repair protein [Erysipelotrichaceae bacterium]|nr:DNA alkylation repair protein [Erysipelotrichaceae bacterium]